MGYAIFVVIAFVMLGVERLVAHRRPPSVQHEGAPDS